MVTYRRADLYPSKSSGKRITPQLLVVHTTEGYGRAYLDGLFSGKYLRDGTQKISVHWCIYRTGDIVEYAPWLPGEAVTCYHAGQSSWHGKRSCNNWSLGYEIEHIQGDSYPEVQIKAILWLNALVQAQYPDIEYVEHAQIADPPGRKTDPTRPWFTAVWPRVQAAWEEGMTLSKVPVATAKEAEANLVKAKLIDSPGKRGYDDAVTVGLFWEMLERFAEKAGYIPKP